MKRALLIALVVALAGWGVLAGQADRQVIGSDLGLPFSSAVRAGGFIYVSGAIAQNPDGSRPEGIAAQTRRTLEQLDETLKQAGSSLQNAVAVLVYLKDPADFQAMNEVYQQVWTADPPTRTTIQANLARADALAEIAVTAVPDGAERVIVRPEGWRPSSALSPAIRSGQTVFLSGLVGRDYATGEVATGIDRQTRAILRNAGQALEAAGLTHADVTAVRVFIRDVALFQDMNTAYRETFQTDRPARATVVAPAMNDQYLIEMTMVAVSDPNRRAIIVPRADGTLPDSPFSSAIEAGGRLFLSGALGVTDETRGDAGAQTREVMSRLGRVLDLAGYDWPDVVESAVFLRSMSDYDAMNAAYRETFTSGDLPARATVEAGLVSADGLVEIMMTAVKAPN